MPLLAPQYFEQSYSNYLGFPTVTLAFLLPVVAILTLTSEWSQRTVLTTFTLEPRRQRVIIAKVVVSLWLAIGGVVLGALVAVGAFKVATVSGRHITGEIHGSQIWGFALFVLLNVLLGAAFGALVQQTAAAIVLFVAVPAALGAVANPLQSVGGWISSSHSFQWVLNGEWAGHTAQIAVSATLWIIVPLVAGLMRTVRRDIR